MLANFTFYNCSRLCIRVVSPLQFYVTIALIVSVLDFLFKAGESLKALTWFPDKCPFKNVLLEVQPLCCLLQVKIDSSFTDPRSLSATDHS